MLSGGVPWLAVFPYLMGVLQVCACITSLLYGNYRLALLWACAATSNFAISGLR